MASMNKVKFEASRIRRTTWKEYAIRFVFGGAITALAGYLGHTYGPTVGGLFLAFPAILPAALTLISNHEGRRAAARDALGAIAGSAGLAAFALTVWMLSVQLRAWQTLGLATLMWLVVSVLVWTFLRRFE
jgi:uncharacterized membrane protein (GlpM family)